MPRPPLPGASTRSLLPALLLPLLLAGCGGDTGPRFAPACPQAAIVADAADLSRYNGPGRDLTDLVLDGRVLGARVSCSPGDAKDTTKVTLTRIGIELTRGPAARGRTVEAAYFVAVLEGDRILDKRTLTLRTEFPSNTDRIRLTGDEVELNLPTSATKTAASYKVLLGFQLQPDELALNRQRGPR